MSVTATSMDRAFTVTQVNALVTEAISRDPRLQTCWVRGEISNFKHHSSGHMYFTLKDERSRLRTIMFASRAKNLAFVPEDGMRVVCLGAIQVFDRDGQYQLYVDSMQPDGVGALFVAFNQLKQKLEEEGLFHAARKRPLPLYPKRIGVVTSPTGAVLRDIRSTLSRRWPVATVILSPALVQGPTAADTIVQAIDRLHRWSTEREVIDVIIVARGGGSLEELWPFNEEVVARAIAASSIPVVSAVGHETDFTISDFVADVRAATPTAAAEVVAPSIHELRMQLGQWEDRAMTASRRHVSRLRERMERTAQAPVLRDPLHIVNVFRQQMDYLDTQLQHYVSKPMQQGQRMIAHVIERMYRVHPRARIDAVRRKLDLMTSSMEGRTQRQVAEANRALDRTIASLEALNPLHVLRRGYAVAYQSDGTVVTSVEQIQPNDILRLTVSDGTFQAKVIGEEEECSDGIQARLDI